jgi:pentatricopeptide repeat protein
LLSEEKVTESCTLAPEKIDISEIKQKIKFFNRNIATNLKEEKYAKAMGFFNQLKSENLKPTIHTYTLMLQVFAKAKDYNNMELLYQQMKTEKLKYLQYQQFQPILSTFASQKKLEKVLQYLKEIVTLRIKFDAEIINQLLKVHFLHNNLDKSLQIWKEMKEKKIIPNHLTFYMLLVLAAKRKRFDLIDQIWSEFTSESPSGFGISPDLFCWRARLDAHLNAGQWKEGLQIIQIMFIKSEIRPDGNMWKAVLEMMVKKNVLRPKAMELKLRVINDIWKEAQPEEILQRELRKKQKKKAPKPEVEYRYLYMEKFLFEELRPFLQKQRDGVRLLLQQNADLLKLAGKSVEFQDDSSSVYSLVKDVVDK